MKELEVKSFAKINLSLDILGFLEDGYHETETIMQAVSLYDKINLKYEEGSTFSIKLNTNKRFLPRDERNLAYKAAKLMAERYSINGGLDIYIEKNIPVAAGLAGGSSNAASVIIGINKLLGLGLELDELLNLGKEIGTDVPFLIYTSIKKEQVCLGVHRGEELKGINSKFFSHLVLAKPRFGVSTKEVYKGMDRLKDYVHPKNEALIEALEKGDSDKAYINMINVLENYTLNEYKEVKDIKEKMLKFAGASFSLMSGSGPTVVGFFETEEQAKNATMILRGQDLEAYFCKTK